MDVLHLDRLITAAAFAGVRIGGVMVFSPFLGSQSIPMQVKAGFTVALTVLLWPAYAPAVLATDAVGWGRVLAGEMLIGLLLGLALQFIFEAAQVAGQIIGVQTGFSLITILDPQTQADTPVLGMFHALLTLLIFLQLNVHHWLLRGVAASFSYLPPGAAVVRHGVVSGLVQAAGAMWLVGLQIATPVIVATMLADVALGFVGKASPQLPVIIVGLSIKNLLGLAVLAGTLVLWPRALEQHFAAAIGLGERLLHLAR